VIHASLGFNEAGGYAATIDKYFHAVASNRSREDPDDPTSDWCGEPPKDAMHLFRYH